MIANLLSLGHVCCGAHFDLQAQRNWLLTAFVVLCRAVNLLKWVCQIPGKKETLWESGFYPLTMEFSEVGCCNLKPALKPTGWRIVILPKTFIEPQSTHVVSKLPALSAISTLGLSRFRPIDGRYSEAAVAPETEIW